MPEPVPCRRPRAGDSSLATVASPTNVKLLHASGRQDGKFWANFHKFESVDNHRSLTAFVSYVTSRSRSRTSIEPRATCSINWKRTCCLPKDDSQLALRHTPRWIRNRLSYNTYVLQSVTKKPQYFKKLKEI